ncbi:SDR family NAD(P)-dependent oxidoreductase [Arthrobacter sp. MYb213]|uniref:SDR family NAD(P)-dependent oxidoreductase n=1 Tax=Arthrobacter sp. MYb213 TaxID=1848595 RepID=UPI000CFB3302|nr:SDR family NAD(P)-dependent oxidoreductase [Arthrobacter sp. MYb213]PRB72337.1 3-oxoacyl-ACP reductase [Arthrobacter sp. MYb213]
MSESARLESVAGLTVLVTGAAQGMGALFARMACLEGAQRLILWDVSGEQLSARAEELTELNPACKIQTQVVDLRNQSAITAAADQVLAGGSVDVLVNNAGVVTGTSFAKHRTAQITDTMAVNSLAPMYLTHALLEQMGTQGRPGRVLTIASAAALVSNPNMSVYAASKAAAMSWSDSLRLELEQEAERNIKVTTFCPTYVSTGMFAGAKSMLLTPIMEPEQVTAKAWNAMLRGTPLVLLPWASKLGQALRGILPRAAWDLVADKVFRIYGSMNEFTGRQRSSEVDETVS